MILNLLLNAVIVILGVMFIWLPNVYTLPSIIGYDIDSALVNAIGIFNSFATSFWVLIPVLQGFLFILAYYTIKFGVRLFLGSRSPMN